jgi:hypothetical protein
MFEKGDSGEVEASQAGVLVFLLFFFFFFLFPLFFPRHAPEMTPTVNGRPVHTGEGFSGN